MSRLSRPSPLERTESDATSCQQAATRTYDRRRGLYAVRVLPGGAYVTRRTDEMIVTVPPASRARQDRVAMMSSAS